jgi:hypothetical protein
VKDRPSQLLDEAEKAALASKEAKEADAKQQLHQPSFPIDEKAFRAAIEQVNVLKTSLDSATKLRFYGLLKQAEFGNNDKAVRPGQLARQFPAGAREA